MSERNSALSIFTDRTIGTKIGAGFAVVLLVLAVSSILAWLAFGRASGAVDDYAGLVARSAIFRDIDLQVAQYRGHVREYVYSNDEATAAMAGKEGEELRQLIALGLAKVVNAERHGLLEDAAKQAAAYAANFERIHALNLEQAKVEADALNPAGQQLTDGFSGLLAAAAKTNNADVQRLGAEGRRLSLVARIEVSNRLGRHDEAASKAAEQQFTDLGPILAQLDTATKDGDLKATAKSAVSLTERYQAAFRRVASLDADQFGLVNGVMKQSGTALAADAIKAKDSNLADQAATERVAQSITGSGETMVMWLGLAGLAAGVVLAWLIGRGIARPVVAMCAAMRALAGGDKTIEIPSVGRKDEIGQMADTVAVFKTNMIEADRLREETERLKVSAEADRKTGMLRLADNFEAGIKGVVNSVASQATEMQSSAAAMTHTAEQATQQATAVAASVEEASANVQTVASSAEELSASVREIGQQVEHSSKIAGQAVVEADKTNTTVEGLAKTAQRIGDVVQLIETIAGQTNLPPFKSPMSCDIRYLRKHHLSFTNTIPMIPWSLAETVGDKWSRNSNRETAKLPKSAHRGRIGTTYGAVAAVGRIGGYHRRPRHSMSRA